MNEKFTTEDIANILQALTRNDDARIADQMTNRPPLTAPIEIPSLTTALTRESAREFAGPFRSIYVETATDADTFVWVIANSRENHNTPFKMAQNSSIEFNFPVSKVFIYWDAQSGKSITLKAFTDAVFRTGKLVSVNAGGVSINDGSAIGAPTKVTLAAGTAAPIVPTSTSRKVAVIENVTGADLFIGDATVNATTARGIKLENGEKYEYRNTAALYGFSVAGGDVWRMDYT